MSNKPALKKRGRPPGSKNKRPSQAMPKPMPKAKAKAAPEIGEVTVVNKDDNLTKAGVGRPKGSLNVVTKTVKAAMLAGLESNGGAEKFFEDLRLDNPNLFASLVVKLLPMQVDVDATVDTHITFELVK